MITQEQINILINRITNLFHPQKIILFGSYANGTFNNESDLDLLIIKDNNLPARYMVRKALADLNISLDIILKTSEEFEKYKDVIGTIIYPANKFGKVIYEA